MRIILAVALALAGTAVQAQTFGSRSVYDWQSGNQYTVTPQYGGGVRIQGFNSQTGSMWNQTQNPNGTYNGMDSQGNFYSGDHRTGSYFNSNGTVCFGSGAARVCN